VHESGWILCKSGNTYVAWFPLQTYEWLEEHDTPAQAKNVIGRPEMLPRTETPRNYRLRSHRPQNGYVIEVRSAAEVGSFEAFAQTVTRRVPRAALNPGNVSVEYTTLSGDQMRFVFPETRTLNGKNVDLRTTRLFEGPHLQADVGSEMLTIKHGSMRRILNFRTLTVTE
jgi:hypothetical protein